MKRISEKTLTKEIAEMANVSYAASERLIIALKIKITDHLIEGDKVSLTGFGTFVSRTRHERGGINPRNITEKITIPQVTVAKFRVGKNLKQALKYR